MGANKRCEARPSLKDRCCALTQSNRDYPAMDAVIIAYTAVVLVFQVLFQISPVMTFLAKTPLYSIQTYLGLLGGGLVLFDLFTAKKIWKGQYCLLLYAILLLAALSSVRTIEYGLKENLFKLCWAAIQFMLVYSCVYRTKRDTLTKYVRILIAALLVIWVIACCVSIYQYVHQIGYRYVVNPLAKDSSSNRQGFYDNRLFGIFYTLNHAAYLSLFFLIIAVAFMCGEKRKGVRAPLLFPEFILLCYIILSGSRSAKLSLIVCSGVLAFFLMRNRVFGQGKDRSLLPIAAALLAALVCTAGCWALKQGLEQVPSIRAEIEAAHEAKAETKAETEPETEPTVSGDVLERDGLDEDISNGRLSIWSDYALLYREVGAIGLSPGNYMPYILENHPDLYIVEYIRENYPDKYESGIIYHVHSGYLMVYVSAGILGLLSLLLFMVLCMKRTIGLIKNCRSVSSVYMGAFSLVVVGAISAALDEGLFFQNNPHTTMFWFALGIIMTDTFVSGSSPEET